MVLLVGAMSLLSCTEGGDRLFEMEIETDFIVPAGLNTFDTHYFIIRAVPSRIRSYMGSLDASQIGQIVPTKAELTAPFVDLDFSIVRQVSIWMISRENPEEREEIFYQDRIDLNEKRELRLFSSLSEVKDILLADNFDLEIRLNFRTFTPTQIETRLRMNFNANGTT